MATEILASQLPTRRGLYFDLAWLCAIYRTCNAEAVEKQAPISAKILTDWEGCEVKRERELAKQPRTKWRLPWCRPSKDSWRFGELFAGLPAEIKVMIIREVMRQSEEVQLHKYGFIWDSHPGRLFQSDEALYIESQKQYVSINSFCLQGRYYWPELSNTVRSLTLDLEIRVEGDLRIPREGDTFAKCWDLSESDIGDISAVPETFPNLEELTVRVRNIGSIALCAVFFLANAQMTSAKKAVFLTRFERYEKIRGILDLVRNLQFAPRWQRGWTTVQKSVVFNQVEQEEYGDVELITTLDPKIASTSDRDYSDRMETLLDTPRAVVVFEGPEAALD